MQSKETALNFWSEEEVSLLNSIASKSIEDIYKIFRKDGFNRSHKAIQKKRAKLGKQEDEKVSIIIDEIIIEKPIEAPAVIVKRRLDIERTLVIPDSHVKPGDDFDRFEALDNFIIEKKPDHIIQLGDFLTFSSLSHWDKNNRLKMEGVRYKEDIDAGNKALDLMFKSTFKSKTYNPNIIWHFGNHDQAWPERYIEQNPALSGHIDVVADLKLAKRGITNIIPYKKYSCIKGTLFTHAPQNAANMPIGGKFAAQKASELTAKSMVFGHTHSTQEFSCQRHGDDHVIQIYVAGCFFHGKESYTEDSTMTHNRCISLLTQWDEGRFDICQISLERLESEYL